MLETDTIRQGQKLHPSEDFDFLKKEGINLIQRLAGHSWTDYNTHDPGITLLEALCYALTDLGYRTSFDVKDLLAGQGNAAEFFYQASQVLPCGPVTLPDYRKLVIDTEGVKNAWVEISNDYEILLYLGSQTNNGISSYELSYQESSGPPLRLKGLYKILVEYEDYVKDNARPEVLDQIRKRIQQHRNLCEDFISISAVEYEPFAMEAELQVNEGADIEKINAQVFIIIQNLFSPAIPFYTLQQMREKGYSTEEIYEGPILKHGFIDPKDLERSGRAPSIHLSDIINRILQVEGVIAVKKCSFPAGSQSTFAEFTEWMKDEARSTEKLVRLDIDQSVIHFVRSGDRYRQGKGSLPDKERVKALYNFLQNEKRSAKLKDPAIHLPVPEGNHMEVEEYYPFQYSLPASYGTGEPMVTKEWGEPQGGKSAQGGPGALAPASKPELLGSLPARKIQVLQLKGYLLVFEQLMADYLAQLAHIGELFSFRREVRQTYFSSSLSGLFDAEFLMKNTEEYRRSAGLSESNSGFLKRRNGILDHMLAIAGEEMNRYSFYQQNAGNGQLGEVVEAKEKFLRDFIQLSNYRGAAFNYSDAVSPWDTTNVSGVKKRVCRLSGIKEYHTAFTTFDWITIEKREEPNQVSRYVVMVRDPEAGNLLLESSAFQTESEVRFIMSYILQNGSNQKLYDVDTRRDKFRYQLKMKNQEGGYDFVAGKEFSNKDDLDLHFRKLTDALQNFGHQENLHLVEHLLLRPKIDPHPSRLEGPGMDSTSVSLLSVLHTPGTVTGTLPEGPKFPYKFKIQREMDKKAPDQVLWKLAVVEERTEVLLAEDKFPLKKNAVQRMVRIRQAGADASNYAISQNADGYFIFSLQDKGRLLAAGKKNYREKAALDAEIALLVNYFSFEINLIKSGDDPDELSVTDMTDPYSFQVSVFIPDWPERFRDPSFRHLLEKAIHTELPSHVYPHIYWLDYKSMRDFENAYKPWLKEMAVNTIPDVATVNQLVSVMNEIRKNN